MSGFTLYDLAKFLIQNLTYVIITTRCVGCCTHWLGVDKLCMGRYNEMVITIQHIQYIVNNIKEIQLDSGIESDVQGQKAVSVYFGEQLTVIVHHEL